MWATECETGCSASRQEQLLYVATQHATAPQTPPPLSTNAHEGLSAVTLTLYFNHSSSITYLIGHYSYLGCCVSKQIQAWGSNYHLVNLIRFLK